MRKRLATSLCLAIAGVCLCGGAVAAQHAKSDVITKQPTKSHSTVVFQGVQVAIDPATGRLRAPTDAERQALTKLMLQRQAAASVMPRQAGERPRTEAEAKATIKRYRHGLIGMAMQVPENQMNYMTAQRMPDGTLRIGHQGDTQAPAKAQEVTK